MQYEYNADIGLAYSSPCRGFWNIVHYGTLVPQSHQIYVCPVSCLRGVVLTTAEMGVMDRMSTITVGEDNLINGDMEEQLYHGTKKILDTLPDRPRMIMIFISCVHHFLAVNYQRIYKRLRAEYPDIDFIDCYMDPIMRRKIPADPSLRRQVMRVLHKAEHDHAQVSFVGSCFAMNRFSDLYQFLDASGVRVLQLPGMQRYDDFLQMEHSCVNFTFHNQANWAGKDMEIRLGQKWMRMRNGYLYDELDEDMDAAAQQLQIRPLTASERMSLQEQTEKSVETCRRQLSGTPLSIDYTAVDKPLELAVYLLEHGFNVESVLVENITESREIFEKLQKMKPQLKVYSSLGWNMRLADRSHAEKIVAIGQKSAYFHDTDYFVNEVENAGMYGYRGIMHLMDLIREADSTAKPMRKLVQQKGWMAGPYFSDICEAERKREQQAGQQLRV